MAECLAILHPFNRLELYQDDGRTKLKMCAKEAHLWLERIPSKSDLNPGPLDQQASA